MPSAWADPEPIQDCKTTDSSQTKLASCAIDGANACWFDSDTGILRCDFEDYGCEEDLEVWALNYDPSVRDVRVSVYGSCSVANEPTPFCCVVDERDTGSITTVVLNGTSYADTFHLRTETTYLQASAGRAVQVNAAGGNDTIWGSDETSSAYSETLSGGSDDDTIRSGHGNDYLYGNGGQDTLFGESGSDQLFGGAGTDHLYGDFETSGADADVLHGGAHTDVLYAGEEAGDVAYGNGGNDTITCHAGDCIGGNGHDTITGGTSYSGFGVRIHGGPGNDTLMGTRYDDVIYGGVGLDELTGREGSDVLCENSRMTSTTYLNAFDIQEVVGGYNLLLTSLDTLWWGGTYQPGFLDGANDIYAFQSEASTTASIDYQHVKQSSPWPNTVPAFNVPEPTACATLRQTYGLW